MMRSASNATSLWVSCQAVLALQVHSHLVVAQVDDRILFEQLRHHSTFKVCGRSLFTANTGFYFWANKFNQLNFRYL